MSYSFKVEAATREAVLVLAEKQMEAVVAGQPCHAQDKAQVLAAVKAVMEPLMEDPAKDISLSVCGSVGWSWQPPNGPEAGKEPLTSCTISVTAVLVARP